MLKPPPTVLFPSTDTPSLYHLFLPIYPPPPPLLRYYTAVFLGGEWGKVDFTWPGRMVCMFLCTAGIALYAIPVGTLITVNSGGGGVGGRVNMLVCWGGESGKYAYSKPLLLEYIHWFVTGTGLR
jgi:hypothetical protein